MHTYGIIQIVKGGEQMAGYDDERAADGMSNQQLDALLETLARLIEAQAQTVEEAAQLVRDAKTNPNK